MKVKIQIVFKENEESAVVKKQIWKCLACDKSQNNYTGKIGSYRVWKKFPLPKEISCERTNGNQNSRLTLVFGNNNYLYKTEQINNNNPHWKISEEFMYTCEAESLKTSHFNMYIQDDSGSLVSQISLTLFDICTGPIHNDMFLQTKEVQKKYIKQKLYNLQQVDNGRITFDIKMAQMINMKISCKSLNMILDENLSEKAYNFSMQIKVKKKKKFSLNNKQKVSQF
ncbi:hypothetical protein IMG5_190370 [Ichthyophthirius multifiliis]|uniref:C2 domain-containing protein n=1 Tax=Ichthyophthirius multifiliis TaxID=5932 RepID=G0R471_ICHMU|nr:hypothetical protein IMG5_190370 [Ichthyophthirius multifiliis]EGR27742.1 hypothetical protein IMG5_190370 [Ichthyophthirius multifiliis]|eukprot:XP_004025194.1 hypothetical protein IMG5_190370 [Ichthyophthirius multifiliis]